MALNDVEKITKQKIKKFGPGVSDSEATKEIFNDVLADYNPRQAYMNLKGAQDDINSDPTDSGIGPGAVITGNNQGITGINADGSVNTEGFDPNYTGSPTISHYSPNINAQAVKDTLGGEFGKAGESDLANKTQKQVDLVNELGGDESDGSLESPSEGAAKASKLGDLLVSLEDV